MHLKATFLAKVAGLAGDKEYLRGFLHFERSENNNRVMKETLKQQEST